MIDPRCTPLANQADMWDRIRPGTDAALILGMLHTVIFWDLYDRTFVEKYCVRSSTFFKEHIAAYPPEKIAEITWLNAAKIKEAARLFAQTKPATVHHRVAVEQNLSSTQVAPRTCGPDRYHRKPGGKRRQPVLSRMSRGSSAQAS